MDEYIKMEIIIGKTAGFCYGVKRAVEGSIEEIKRTNLLFRRIST